MRSALNVVIILFILVVTAFLCVVSATAITAHNRRQVITTDCRYSCRHEYDSQKYDLEDKGDKLYCVCYKEMSKMEIK